MMNNSEKIKEKLTGNEELAFESMLQGETIIETANNLAVSIPEAQALRKAVYSAAEEFVEFGDNTKQKQKKLIDFCNQNESKKENSTNDKNNIEELEKQLEPFKDEYFNGLSTKQIAALAKKANKLTEENSKLAEKLDNMKEALECAKHNVQIGQETIEQQAKNVEELLEEKTKENRELRQKINGIAPNFLVFNPYHGQPNKVYKNYQTAFEDAKAVAKKEQKPVFILRIDALVVPQCSFDVHDTIEKGIPEKYLKDSIPF